MQELKNLIDRDLDKYYCVYGEDNEGKIRLIHVGNFSQPKKNIILAFEDIYLYENSINQEDINKGIVDMIYYQTPTKKVSFTAVIDKTTEYDITKSVKCHFEIRCYANNEVIILQKIDLFPGSENIIYILSDIIGGYV